MITPARYMVRCRHCFMGVSKDVAYHYPGLEMRKHIDEMHNNKQYRCKLCNNLFRSEHRLWAHQNTRQYCINLFGDQLDEPIVTMESKRCKKCGYLHPNWYKNIKPESEKNLLKQYRCFKCYIMMRSSFISTMICVKRINIFLPKEIRCLITDDLAIRKCKKYPFYN